MYSFCDNISIGAQRRGATTGNSALSRTAIQNGTDIKATAGRLRIGREGGYDVGSGPLGPVLKRRNGKLSQKLYMFRLRIHTKLT